MTLETMERLTTALVAGIIKNDELVRMSFEETVRAVRQMHADILHEFVTQERQANERWLASANTAETQKPAESSPV
jgi:hypothetical protein